MTRDQLTAGAVVAALISGLSAPSVAQSQPLRIGHLYCAKPVLAAHYRALDPGNRLNPGLGGTSRRRDWA